MLKRFFLVLLLISVTPLLGQTTVNSLKEQPFFFPKGMYRTTDPLRQREEYERIFMATSKCTQGSQGDVIQTLIPGSDSLSVQTSVVSTDSVTENPAKMKIILDHYLRLADGRIRVTNLCGQDFISEDQLKVVENELQAIVVDAAQRDNDFYNLIYDKAITARAEKLGVKKSELEKELDEPVPDYPQITFRELNRLPKPSKPSDFIPRELHLGFNPPLGGILGVTWLNTGVIYYNPNAWMTDYLNGIPKVMQHEMIHGNINIEKFPMSEAFDVELMASLPMMLYTENTTDLPTHSYAADIRELAEVYFNMDWAQMKRDIVKFDFAGNVQYDDQKYEYYYGQIETVKKEMMTFFQNVTIPEFYSDPVWWSAINDLRGDNNTVFRITMADHYQATILGGAKATMEWENQNRDLIYQIAQEATAKALAPKKNGQAMMITPYMQEEYDRLFTPQERDTIQKYFTQHPDQLDNLRKMTPAEAIQFMQRFKTTDQRIAR